MVGTATWGPRVSSSLAVRGAALAFLLFGFWSFVHGESSALYAAVALLSLLTVFTFDKALGICAAFAYLILLGDIRRTVGWLFGFPTYDPLILVGAAFAFLIAAPVLLRPRLTGLTEKLSLALMAMMFLQIFNPAQGGILTGLLGAVIAFPPLLWFWIGRTFGTEPLMRRVLSHVVLPLAILAALLGYYQTFIGSPFWQQAWVDRVTKTFAALHVGSHIRAFGFSTTGIEYMNLMFIAAVVCIVGIILGRMILWIPLLTLIPAILLGSTRSIAVRLLVAAVIGYTFKNRGKGPLSLRFIIILGVGVALFAVLLSRVGGYNSSGESTSAADQQLAHELGGLAHPLDSKYSTAADHTVEIWYGLVRAVQYPIGFGLGSTNMAAIKSGSGVPQASEFDISDSFLSLGLLGGFLYIAFIISVLRDAIRYTRTGSRNLSLIFVSLTFALVGAWLFPGEYSNGPILWFLIGCVNRESAEA